MLRCIPLRLAILVLLAATLLPAAAFAQSQDTQSVAEAARRVRAQKKNAEKPAKVITDETLDVKKGDVQSATAEQLRIPGTPDASAQPATGASNPQSGASANPPASSNASDDEKARALLKKRVPLKEKIKDAQSDLDLLQREFQLDQETFYSSPDYANNPSGKAKLDAMKQQISDKQQEIERLKTELAALPAAPESPAATPPKP
jgi:HAMP domain-containing protein